MDEIWAVIERHPDYSVSSYGRVRNDRNGRILALQRNQAENIYVGLSTDGRQRTVSVPKLVVGAFLENPYEDEQMNAGPMHLDGDRSNNFLTNLVIRPRWYAICYQMQFPDPKPMWVGEIVELGSERVFNNSLHAALYFGVIDLHVLISVLHEERTPVVNYNFRRHSVNKY